MVSPFEELSDQVAVRIRGLPAKAQVLLLTAAATALRPLYLKWHDTSGQASAESLFEQGLEAANRFALAGVSPSRPLLEAIEASTPSAPSDIAGFTAAQDCWVCVDAALRTALGEFDPGNAAWYMLEPMFQAVSERLFGLYDVGSTNQQDAEFQAIGDPALVAAVSSLSGAIAYLRSFAAPTKEHLDECVSMLMSIVP